VNPADCRLLEPCAEWGPNSFWDDVDLIMRQGQSIGRSHVYSRRIVHTVRDMAMMLFIVTQAEVMEGGRWERVEA
jgi:hypothetical protein